MHPDYGLDYTVEVFDADGNATGRSFHAQLKATDESNRARALGGVRFRRETADYYRSLTLPVLIVLLHAPSNQLFARWFHAYNPHLALRDGGASDAKSIRFQFYEADAVGDETPALIDAGLRGFLKFRSPELALPLRVAVTADEGVEPVDVFKTTFALRSVLDPVSDLVAVEARDRTADEPSIALGRHRSAVSLANVASVTLDTELDADTEAKQYAADLGLALSVALAYVGQANLSAQIAYAVAPASRIIAAPEVSTTIAGGMFRSRRTREAIELADALDSSSDTRVAAFAFLTTLLARGDRLTDDEREIALATSEKRLERRLQRGDKNGAASEAYNLAMLHKRLRDAPSAIDLFRRTAELDNAYFERGYYHSDFAGVLFENGDFAEAAEHYGRAIELGQGGLTWALHADALLFSGQYRLAQERLDEYLSEHPGPEAAEWRLKRHLLPLLIETVGDEQERQPRTADELLDSWDFETGPDMSIEEAWRLCSDAVALDACSGRAWFRLGLLAIGGRENPRDGARFATAGAMLLRNHPGAWTNAVLCSDPGDEDSLRDLLYAGYRLAGDDFVRGVTDAVSGAEHLRGSADRIIELLHDAVVRVDAARATEGFTIRFRGDEGEMHELVFGPGEETDLSATATLSTAAWSPGNAARKPKSNARSGASRGKKRRPGKTYGKSKRSRKRRRK